jgi:hypothetical protein
MKKFTLSFTLIMLCQAITTNAEIESSGTRYAIRGETVYDKKTDLTWARCSVGQQWRDGIGCIGKVKKFSFEEAQKQGTNGWRVPTEKELLTIQLHFNKAQDLRPSGKLGNIERPAIDIEAFPDMDLEELQYWTSTPSTQYRPYNGMNVGFGYVSGSAEYDGNHRHHPLRLVRSGLQ